MNKFVFLITGSGKTWYGSMEAQDGRAAKEILQEWVKQANLEEAKIHLSGVMSKKFHLATTEP